MRIYVDFFSHLTPSGGGGRIACGSLATRLGVYSEDVKCSVGVHSVYVCVWSAMFSGMVGGRESSSAASDQHDAEHLGQPVFCTIFLK